MVRNLKVYYVEDLYNESINQFWLDLIKLLSVNNQVEIKKLEFGKENYIFLQKMQKKFLEIFACNLVIEDINSGEFWIVSFCDQMMSNILSEKENPFLKKVLYSQYIPDHIIRHVGVNYIKYEPWIYFSFNDINLDFFYEKRKDLKEFKPKMIFGGTKNYRPIIDFVNPTLIDYVCLLDKQTYFDKIINYKIGFSVGGAAVGDICFRDIEYMAVGIPFLKFNYVTTLNPPLIPNYHYISIPYEDLPTQHGVYTDRLGNEKHAKLIEKRFLEVINDNNFLEFVANNAKKYYDTYLSKDNRLSHTLNLLKIDTNMNNPKLVNKNNKTTIVTGLWDLGRGEINNSFKRSYDDYKEKFSQLLKTDVNMYIFCDPSDEEFIWTHRSRENTVINLMSLDKLTEWFNFTEITNEIRQKEEWISQSGWLRESPQATLKGYNPLVMSKMFMLNNVTIWNPFNSEYFFWLDAGITNTVHYGYFTHDKVLDKLPNFIDENKDFVFLTYPYIGGEEIHGFPREAIARYANTDYVKYVCRGGFFGGKKERINEINGLYYSYLSSSLNDGYMGTEESVFSIVLYNHSDLICQYNLHDDGLVWRFFEDIKDNKFVENVKNRTSKNTLDKFKTSLYVLTFNSPKQFETLIESMIQYDCNFIDKPKKYLLNNSTDESTFDRYEELCAEYEFVHIKKDNLGICGGRQFISEHFDASDSDYMFFFEDDMFFYPKKGEVCRNGFNRFVDNFYHSVMDIIHNHNFDFLKFNYSEFFGDNGTQWSWYNVPQNVRDEFFPEKNKLPEHGLDPNAPRTKYNNVWSHNGIPYVDGDIYYSNWPQVVSRQGNEKMFLETKWAHPFEQTWMSYIFQETKKGIIKPAILLMTPTEHDRFDHYSRELRKES